MIPEVVETQFADLRLPCSHDGKTIHLALTALCTSMLLDAPKEVAAIAQDAELAPLVKPMPPTSRIQGPALPIGAVTLWLERLQKQRNDTPLRHRVAVLQQEGFATLLDQWVNVLDKSASIADIDGIKRRFKRTQAQICAMDDALADQGSAIEREILQVQLNQLCGFPVRARPEQSALLEDFWRLLFARMTTGTEINHARRSDHFLALNFRHLKGVLDATSDNIEVTSELRDELRRSRHPHFLGVRVVNSRIARKSLRCWVFNLH